MPYRPGSEASDRPRPAWWAYFGGAALAGVAGFVNTLLLLSSYHVAVSHMTGAVSSLAIDIEQAQGMHAGRIASIILGFLLGAVLSGVIIGGTTLKLGRRYGVAMMIESALLGLAAWRLTAGDLLGLALASAACGLQNGMASSYLGLILRTTHVTGLVTDIGVMLGHWLRHRRVELWKLLLLIMLFAGFCLGCVVAAEVSGWLGIRALWIASLGMGVAGAVYAVWRNRHATEFVGRG